MKIVDGKKITQQQANILFLEACRYQRLDKIKYAVEELGADVNFSINKENMRGLVYICQARNVEKHIDYLLKKGVEVNFKYGHQGYTQAAAPYFLYYVVKNLDITDSMIYLLIIKVKSELKRSESITDYLNYVPTVKAVGGAYQSIAQEIEANRPDLYKWLINEKILSNKNVR